MIIIRPIRETDLEQYEKLAFTATLGITNLPKNKELLKAKIHDSLQAFSEKNPKSGKQNYCFVLEDLKSGELGGTCGIFARTGIPHPLIYYKLETLPDANSSLPVPKKMQILRVITHKKGPTEICALYIAPDWRKEGLGRLLSLSRFFFIANFPDRFEDTVFAEMRGFITQNETSPFWDGLGRHFLDMDYNEIIAAQEMGNRNIYEALPQHPIYVSLLPKETQEVIGKTHPNTKPALNMLTKEGFHLTGEVDLFDAGPRIAAKTQDIATIRNSKTVKVQVSDEKIESERYMISNTKLDFRNCYGMLKQLIEDAVLIDRETAQALEVKDGDTVRILKAVATER